MKNGSSAVLPPRRLVSVAAAFCLLVALTSGQATSGQSARNAVRGADVRTPPKQNPDTHAKRTRTSAAAQVLSPAQLSLDDWVIRRFRGAELLPDSGVNFANTVSHAGVPLVDGARTAEHRDTVVALHFDTTLFKPALANAATVRFADASGAVSGISGHITARRAFRAPRTPDAVRKNAADWRIGWAYLVAVPLKTANAVTSGLNGWALIESPSPNMKRANN